MRWHVHKKLSAYHRGELPVVESRRVAEHVLRCERCREAHDDVLLTGRSLEALPRAIAPDELWEEIEAALAAPPRAPASARIARYAAAAAILVVAGLVAAIWLGRSSGPAWSVNALGGTPLVASSPVAGQGRIGIGDSLVTDAVSRAEIRVGAIGTVEVEPNSCVRMVEARMTEHRIALERGTLRARILAPPRLFFVDTPSGVAVDYGCAYTLSVDDEGSSLLHVTSGRVALELGGRSSLVPAGAMCATKPGVGPGTPYFDDAPERLRAALRRFDFERGGSDAIASILECSRPRDSLTLWYLLARTSSQDRASVCDRLMAIAPPPAGITRERVLALDSTALDDWRAALERTW